MLSPLNALGGLSLNGVLSWQKGNSGVPTPYRLEPGGWDSSPPRAARFQRIRVQRSRGAPGAPIPVGTGGSTGAGPATNPSKNARVDQNAGRLGDRHGGRGTRWIGSAPAVSRLEWQAIPAPDQSPIQDPQPTGYDQQHYKRWRPRHGLPTALALTDTSTAHLFSSLRCCAVWK